jgi:hypothetical protein
LANEEAKHNTEKGPKGIVAKKKKAQGEKIETRSKVRTSSQQLLNWIIQFPKLDHPVSPDSKQKRTFRTTVSRMAPTPRWCPPGLTPSLRRI